MQRKFIAMAVTALIGGAASAQSSVTVFGIADLAATNVKNGSAGSLKTLANGQSNTSRLGFRGVEDLGGGLKAGFWLEGQVDFDNGGANFDWQRRATVSLVGSFGEIRLGRDQNPTYIDWGARDIWGYVGVATTSNLRGGFLSLGGATTGVRTSNSIAYFTPSMGGLFGHFMVGAGEGGTGNKYIGGRLGYRAGNLEVSGSTGKTYKTGAMLDDLSTTSFGGSYELGLFGVEAGYEKAEYSTRDRTLMTVALRVQVGSGRIKAQYTKSSGTGGAATPDEYDATLLSLGYEYRLSKRSLLYTNYGQVDNGGTTVTGANRVASGNGPSGIRRGETSTGYQFGVRHNF
jgi:predicted porin